MDVRDALRSRKWDNRRAHDDALDDLAQRILLEVLLELGRPDQHNLDELLCGDFQVREQPELFEGRERHALGVIDENRNIRWCPSIACMKERRSDVDRSLVEP